MNDETMANTALFLEYLKTLPFEMQDVVVNAAYQIKQEGPFEIRVGDVVTMVRIVYFLLEFPLIFLVSVHTELTYKHSTHNTHMRIHECTHPHSHTNR